MTSTVTTPSRPLAAGTRPRRSGPAVLSLSKGGGGPRLRRKAPSTSCAALASPDKQRTANKLPLSPRKKQQEKEERATDYSEVAAALESIYKLSPAVEVEEDSRHGGDEDDHGEGGNKSKKKRKSRVAGRSTVVVKSRRRRRGRRMDLGKRVEMKSAAATSREGEEDQGEREFEEMLLREYSVSTDMGSLDWKRMKMPPVLTSSQSARLFKTMQPMKAIFEVQESFREELQRGPTDAELAEATGMIVHQLRRRLDVGRAARNKLIKHNLRLVPYAINKYYPEMGSDERFDDLCQAGANGLITAIDQFEPNRGFRISTYALFWIRHSIVRDMNPLSFRHGVGAAGDRQGEG